MEGSGGMSDQADDLCGEMFYGWAPKGQWHMDYSVPRWCDLPVGHGGSHDWSGPPTP